MPLAKEPEVKKFYFECDCGCSVAQLSSLVWDEYTIFVEFVIFGQHDTSLKERLKHIWWIIKYGHPWGARELILRGEDAIRLGEAMIALGKDTIPGD